MTDYRTADEVLHESEAYLNSMNLTMMGEDGAKYVFANPEYKAQLIESLTEGCDSNTQAEIAQLYNNFARTLNESAITDIKPVPALCMPVIRKVWPATGAKESLKTIVATAPAMVISVTKPYLHRVKEDGTEETMDLPRGAWGRKAASRAKLDVQTVKRETVLTAGSFVTEYYAAEGAEANAKAAVKTPLDGAEFRIDKVVLSDNKEIRIDRKIGLSTNMIINVPYSGGDVQLIVDFAPKAATCKFLLVGSNAAFTGAKVVSYAKLSPEFNEIGWTTSIGVDTMSIKIGAGKHSYATVTTEALQDSKALYNIDLAAELTDVMTAQMAQETDVEIIDFMLDRFLNRPANKDWNDLSSAQDMTFDFDVAPAPGYAGSPTLWLEELKRVIDIAATRILGETWFKKGTFTITGAPIDIGLLNHVDWSYKGGNGGNVDGVAVDYSVGVYQGASRIYKVVQTQNFDEGKLLINFIPSGDNQLSQAYFPYTFTIEKSGYRDPNAPLVPSLTMTKRHTLFEYTPTSACIHIIGNDGKGHIHKGNLYDHEFKNANSVGA